VGVKFGEARSVSLPYREVRQKSLRLLCRADRRMLHIMKTDEAFDPVTVGLFGFAGQPIELDSP
tara:strand:- start:1248 stop:1439 length:192 start_codon:yes stop_codon:yes gene_type:complete